MEVFNIDPTKTKVGDFEINALTLGEQGRGRTYTIVPAPTPEYDYLEPGLSKTRRTRLNKSGSSNGWLARIKTTGSYVRGAVGRVYVSPEFKNNVSVIARGSGAYGDAGRIGNWDDIILCLLDETWVRVKPCRHDAYVLYFGEEAVFTLSYPEAEALEFDLCGSTAGSKGEMIQL